MNTRRDVPDTCRLHAGVTGPTARRLLATFVALHGVAHLAERATPSSGHRTAPRHAFYADNGAGALLQATLVHGIADIALAVFVVALARSLGACGARTTRVRVAGLAAVAVSLIQYAMEMALSRAADGGHVAASGTLFHAVHIADTVKLVLLAVAIAEASRVAASTDAFPRWVRALGFALVPALVLGGVPLRRDVRRAERRARALAAPVSAVVAAVAVGARRPLGG